VAAFAESSTLNKLTPNPKPPEAKIALNNRPSWTLSCTCRGKLRASLYAIKSYSEARVRNSTPLVIDQTVHMKAL
jgi:hypothetical protein